MKNKKYSLIICAYDHLEDATRPCMESLEKYMTWDDVEIVFVNNGCNDDTDDYVHELITRGFPINYIKLDTNLGYAGGNNAGMKAATGDYLVLINNDIELLPQPTNKWLKDLEKPFQEDPKIGITGVKFHVEVGHKFLIFFCVMIKREVYEKVGDLDLRFKVGGMEDVDYCIRAEQAGYKLEAVNHGLGIALWHKGELTVHHTPAFNRDKWEENFKNNQKLLAEKYPITDDGNVTVTISTKGREFTTLIPCLFSIINQTYLPKEIIIYDDGDRIDLRNEQMYQNIFKLMENKGIEWKVIWGEGKGQVKNHQKAIYDAKYELIFRVDDDVILESNVIKRLVESFKPDVAAVAGLIINPKQQAGFTTLASNKIEDIFFGINIQWMNHPQITNIEVDHLYSSFIYRKSVAMRVGYEMSLSRKGFREETMFTYGMKRLGYRLLVNTGAVAHHLEWKSGGCRSDEDNQLYQHDEIIFKNKLKEWGIVAKPPKFIYLDCGRGDLFVFKKLLPEIKEKYKDFQLVLGVTWEDVMWDVKDIKIINSYYMKPYINELEHSIYFWMQQNNWKGKLTDAFRKRWLG